jgi:hypothetical protein
MSFHFSVLGAIFRDIFRPKMFSELHTWCSLNHAVLGKQSCNQPWNLSKIIVKSTISVELQVASRNMRAFWYIALCSLVEVDRRFRGSYCLSYQGDDASSKIHHPNDKGSQNLWNVGLILRHYNTAQYPLRLSSFQYHIVGNASQCFWRHYTQIDRRDCANGRKGVWLILLIALCEPGSSVSIVSGYGLDDRAVEVRSLKEMRGLFIWSLCPDRLWDPPSLLSNGYRGSFPQGVKRGWGMTVTTHPHLLPRSRMSRSYASSSPKRLRRVYWDSFTLLYVFRYVSLSYILTIFRWYNTHNQSLKLNCVYHAVFQRSKSYK